MRYASSRLRRPNPGPSVDMPTVGSPVPAKYAQPHSLCIQFSVSGFAGVGYRPIDWQANCSTKRRLLVRPMIANHLKPGSYVCAPLEYLTTLSPKHQVRRSRTFLLVNGAGQKIPAGRVFTTSLSSTASTSASCERRRLSLKDVAATKDVFAQ